MNVALCPGSYDPVTVGHLDVIARCSAMFDDVVVGVVDDSFRKSALFSIEERMHFLEIHQASVECEDHEAPRSW